MTDVRQRVLVYFSEKLSKGDIDLESRGQLFPLLAALLPKKKNDLGKVTSNFSLSVEAILKNEHIVSYIYSGWESKNIRICPVTMYILGKHIGNPSMGYN